MGDVLRLHASLPGSEPCYRLASSAGNTAGEYAKRKPHGLLASGGGDSFSKIPVGSGDTRWAPGHATGADQPNTS